LLENICPHYDGLMVKSAFFMRLLNTMTFLLRQRPHCSCGVHVRWQETW